MISQLPTWVNALFLFAFVCTIILFYISNGKAPKATLAVVLWSFIQAGLAYSGFYQDTEIMPPRFALVLLPSSLVILISLLPRFRKTILGNRDNRYSTLLHTVRIPVEIVLLQLYLHGSIPELMTFEGQNFDILAGISALVIVYFLFVKRLNSSILLLWNFIGLALIFFILVIALLSAPLPFQQLAFDQPNLAVSYFPFILLPATIVPIVIWTHITDIMYILSIRKNEKAVEEF